MFKLDKKYFLICLFIVSIISICLIFKTQIKKILYLNSSISNPTSLHNHQVIQRDFNTGVANVSFRGRAGWLAKKVYVNFVDINSPAVLNDRWILLDSNPTFTNYSGTISVPSGRFNLFIKSKRLNNYQEVNNELNFGVGEVFIVAGQSNASGLSEKFNRSITNHVSTGDFDGNALNWRNCSDPQQPNWGGSVWPLVGDSLYKLIKVPIGFINISALGSNIKNWQKGTDNYEKLIQVLKVLKPSGGCRAVLWQQGESDHNIKKDTYKKLVLQLIEDCNKDLGITIPWIMACSSYNKGIVSNDLQQAQMELVSIKKVYDGPMIDSLNENYRSDNLHLNGKGTVKAADLWTKKIYEAFFKN